MAPDLLGRVNPSFMKQIFAGRTNSSIYSAAPALTATAKRMNQERTALDVVSPKSRSISLSTKYPLYGCIVIAWLLLPTP
jgi:hypothetical protein